MAGSAVSHQYHPTADMAGISWPDNGHIRHNGPAPSGSGRALGHKLLALSLPSLAHASKTNFVAGNYSLVNQLHGVAIELQGLSERDLVSVDFAVGDLRLSAGSAHTARQGIAVRLQIEGCLAGLSVPALDLGRPPPGDIRRQSGNREQSG